MSVTFTLKDWVENWKRVGPELEAIRRSELVRSNTAEAIERLGGWVRIAVKQAPPGPDSGLVIMQAWFAKLRR